MVIWEGNTEAASCKVAVGGDFLPAGSLQPTDVESCVKAAEGVRPVLENADVLFLNLECPIDIAGLRSAPKSGLGATLGAPCYVLHYLSRLRAVPIALANNHIFDFGTEGFQRTHNALVACGMVPLGCGQTTSDKPAVYVWNSPSGVRVGFWAAARVTSRPATTTRIGTEPATPQRAREAFAELSKHGAQCCIALVHAGLERTNYPDPDDVALMDSFVEAGFSFVAACHSHRISGFRVSLTGKSATACFYGLGSIASGMMYSELEREGIVAIISLNVRGEMIRITANPVVMDECGWGVVPSVDRGECVMERFRTLSARVTDNTYRQLFYRDVGEKMFARQLRDIQAAFRHAGVSGVLQKLGRARFRHINRAFHSLIQW